MTIYLNDDRDYTEIVEGWVREFVCTMDEGHLEPGDDSGDAPFGVKIILMVMVTMKKQMRKMPMKI